MQGGFRHWVLLLKTRRTLLSTCCYGLIPLSQLCSQGLDNWNFPVVPFPGSSQSCCQGPVSSQQWFWPSVRKQRWEAFFRPFHRVHIEMQTLLWRLWKFWEIFGFGWCFQETWHSGPVGGWFVFSLSSDIQVQSVPDCLLQGKIPTWTLNKRVTFFFPNLEWWPVNLKTFFCYVFSPSEMQFPDVHPLLSPAGRLAQAWGTLAVTSFVPCRMATWTWWGQCGTVLVSLPQHPDCSELSASGSTCVTEYTHSLL